VLPDPDDSTAIRGYYTLSSFSVGLTDLPEDARKRLPKYPLVPATMPGRLAVSENHRNQGLGEFLLLDALKQSLISSGVIGSTMVVVDPKNESAARFYQRYGFQPIQENGSRLFLPMGTIAQLFSGL
jgi:GNAT superfamily N-acetyltransferase